MVLPMSRAVFPPRLTTLDSPSQIRPGAVSSGILNPVKFAVDTNNHTVAHGVECSVYDSAQNTFGFGDAEC